MTGERDDAPGTRAPAIAEGRRGRGGADAPRAAASPSDRARDPAVGLLASVALAALLLAPFLLVAPDRLAAPRGLRVFAFGVAPLASLATPLVVILAASCRRLPRSARAVPVGFSAAAALVILPVAAGWLASGEPGVVSLGPALYAAGGAAAFVLVRVLPSAPVVARVAIPLAISAALAAAAAAGVFHDLAIVVLAREHARGLLAATLRHVALSAGTVAIAVAAGVPLGVLAERRPRVGSPLYAVLNFLQTVPSIAAFALLIGPLTALGRAVPFLGAIGVGGIGWAPALLALSVYALLPIVRNVDRGIATVDPATREAARAMGMGRLAVLRGVELPLAMPAVIAGTRVVAVQTIGLATIAALIGGGGLGRYVFAGIGDASVDQVLLGALPITALALAAHGALGALEGRLVRRRAA